MSKFISFIASLVILISVLGGVGDKQVDEGGGYIPAFSTQGTP
jgi:hypothetical protein